jgi:hypothetical protein
VHHVRLDPLVISFMIGGLEIRTPEDCIPSKLEDVLENRITGEDVRGSLGWKAVMQITRIASHFETCLSDTRCVVGVSKLQL